MSSPRPQLAGKVAVVTGSSRGIGAEVAAELARQGASVICAARTLHDDGHPLGGSLDETVAGIVNEGGEARAVAVNLADADDCQRLIATAKSEFGSVDILVNNAAVGFFGPFESARPKQWTLSWNVMCHSVFLLSQAVIGGMRAGGGGRIVNITSESAIGPGRGPYGDDREQLGDVLYGTFKASVERFTQGLAQELYASGIGVAALAPSLLVPTPGAVHNGLVNGVDDPRAEPPSHMASAVRLLCTQPLDVITGRVVYSQQLLTELGEISDGRGYGVDDSLPRSGFSVR